MLQAEPSSPDTFLIRRDRSNLAGSIVRVGDQWRVEIMWSGPGGDIVYDAPSVPVALAFIEGVDRVFERVSQEAVTW